MEIIRNNKKTLARYEEKRKIAVSIKAGYIRIFEQAMTDLKLKVGMRVVFVIDIDRLYFYLAKTEDEEGFLITAQNGSSAGKICCTRLIRLLLKRFPFLGHKNNDTHPIRLSNTQLNSSLTFEILLNKEA